MKTRNLISVLILLLLASCGQSNPANPKVDSAVQTVTNEESTSGAIKVDSSFAVEFKRAVDINSMNGDFEKFKKNANRFQVIVNVQNDQTLENGIVLCGALKDRNLSNEVFKSNFHDGKEAITTINLTHATKYAVDISCQINEGNKVIKSFEHTFYKDAFIDDEVNFNDLSPGLNPGENKIGALIISSRGSLITKGADIKIITTDLVMEEGGRIETFTKDDLLTQQNLDGSSGGVIKIIAENAAGTFKAEMRGRNAGSQTNTRENKPALNIAQKTIDVEALSCPQINKGQNGMPGEQGFPGLNGGDSGQLILIIKDLNKMTIDKSAVTFAPGLGSEGGPGGKGGPGAPGDYATYHYYQEAPDSSCSRHCISGKRISGSCQAPAGDQGKDGAQGPRGSDGKIRDFIFANKEF